MMEVYAAALAHADHQMGRIIDAIEQMGDLDNTLIIYIQGDNGASAEGSRQGLLNEMTGSDLPAFHHSLGLITHDRGGQRFSAGGTAAPPDHGHNLDLGSRPAILNR